MSKEQGYSRLPNDVLDHLMGLLSGNAFKVYMAIFRKTAGFNKATDSIPLVQLHELTGIKKPHTLHACIDELEQLNLIIVGKSNGKVNQYSLTNQCLKKALPKMDTSADKRHEPVPQKVTTTSAGNGHTSKDNTKNTIQKTVSVTPSALKPSPKPKAEPKEKSDFEKLIELGCSEQLAKDFIKHRKVKKSAITDTALRLMASQASKAGITFSQAAEIAIAKGWVGFNASWKWQDDQPLAQYPVNQKPAYQSAAERTAAEQKRWSDYLNGSPDERDITPKKTYLISEVGHA